MSRFRGVSLTRGDRWESSITVSSKTTYLGTFDSEIEAAKAFDAAAVVHQKRPVLNFPVSVKDRNRITLTHGKYALIDPENHEWLSRYKWHCAGKYAVSNSVRMHRLVNRTPSDLATDHIR